MWVYVGKGNETMEERNMTRYTQADPCAIRVRDDTPPMVGEMDADTNATFCQQEKWAALGHGGSGKCEARQPAAKQMPLASRARDVDREAKSTTTA